MDRINVLLLYLPALLLAFTVHEFGHAWVAYRQGDDTAYRLGRVTLDPRSHIDPIGSILFPAIATLSGGLPLLGWARPVPVDVRKLRNYRTGDILVSLAGVFMNFMLVLASTLVLAILFAVAPESAGEGSVLDTVFNFVYACLTVNLGLMFFNILPVPPLDGSKVLYHFLPASARESYRQLDRYGFIILYAPENTSPYRMMKPYRQLDRYGFIILYGLVFTGALDFLSPLIVRLAGFFLGIAALAA